MAQEGKLFSLSGVTVCPDPYMYDGQPENYMNIDIRGYENPQTNRRHYEWKMDLDDSFLRETYNNIESRSSAIINFQNKKIKIGVFWIGGFITFSNNTNKKISELAEKNKNSLLTIQFVCITYNIIFNIS